MDYRRHLFAGFDPGFSFLDPRRFFYQARLASVTVFHRDDRPAGPLHYSGTRVVAASIRMGHYANGFYSSPLPFIAREHLCLVDPSFDPDHALEYRIERPHGSARAGCFYSHPGHDVSLYLFVDPYSQRYVPLP